MKKIVIIRPFFGGHFLNYFQLFLNSCKDNPDFDWMIFTDNEDVYDYPSNVHKVRMTFEEAKKLVNSKFDFEVSLDTPYKLCDYKAAFGYIFGEYIKEYDFWGHTDYDVIYGNLRNFITDDMLDKYDKLFTLGHFTLYRNIPEITTLFMKEIQGRYLYKEALQSNTNCNFDEDWNGILNVNDIFREYGKNIYENKDNESNIADIYTKSSDFRVTYQRRGEWKDIIERKKNAFFVHENGKLLRYEIINGKLKSTEYMYIHLQKRNMVLKEDVLNANAYKIIPNAFEKIECEISIENFSKIRKKYFNLHYLRLRYKNLKVKIKRMFNQ